MMVELSPGKIIVNEIRHAVSGENFHAFEIDLASKYPGGVTWDFGLNDLKVWIEPNFATMNQARTEDETFVTIPLSGEGWRCMSEAKRYTWRIVCWRPDRIEE